MSTDDWEAHAKILYATSPYKGRGVDIYPYPADTLARVDAGGADYCSNCRFIFGGHIPATAYTRCLFDKSAAVRPPTMPPDNNRGAITKYSKNMAAWYLSPPQLHPPLHPPDVVQSPHQCAPYERVAQVL